MTSASTGVGLADICVTANRSPGDAVAYARTAADGGYVLSGLDASDYRVKFAQCTGTAYVDRYYGHALTYTLATRITVSSGQAVNGIDEALDAAGSISGRLVDDRGLPPIGLCVLVNFTDYSSSFGPTERTIQTDANGRYIVTNIPAGSYVVFAAGCGAATTHATSYYPGVFVRTAARPISVTAGADTAAINFAVPRAGTVSGTVTTRAGTPVAGLCVEVHLSNTAGADEDRSARTDAAGRYTVAGVQPGARYVEFMDCDDPRAASLWYSGTASPTTATAIEVLPATDRPGVDVVIDAGATMSGSVTDTTGAPVAGACVQVFRGASTVPAGGVTSDNNGAWAIPGLEGGADYYVGFGCSDDRYAPAYNGGAVRPADAPRLTLPADGALSGVNGVMQFAGTISGRVTRADDGTAIKDAQVSVLDSASYPSGFTYTDSFGNYTVRRLNPGDYTVRFVVNGARAEHWYAGASSQATATPVTVSSGAERAGVNGQITFPSGLPGAPPAPGATPRDAALAMFVPAPSDSGASPLTAMEVLADGVVVASIAPYSHNVTVTGLTNGRRYAMTTRARNSQGAGPESPATYATPSAQTTISISAPSAVTYPGTVVVSARLRRALTGGAVGGVPLKLYGRPHGANNYAYIGSASTATDGLVRFTRRPTTSTDYMFRYDGNAAYRGSMSPEKATFLTAPITVTASASTIRLGQSATFTVSVAPNRAGTVTYLQRYSGGAWRTVASRSLASTSRTSFVVRPTTRGTFTYRIYTPYRTTFAAAFSRSVALRVG